MQVPNYLQSLSMGYIFNFRKNHKKIVITMQQAKIIFTNHARTLFFQKFKAQESLQLPGIKSNQTKKQKFNSSKLH